jgi:serine/threonine protein phosphatase PrpC
LATTHVYDRRLNRQLKKAQEKTKGELSEEQIYEACSVAYKGCSWAMENNAYFNVDFAGTTAISAYIQSSKKRVFISNVGDSRAVLGRDSTAIPLSWDQTPYRGSERRRIREAGARILSIDQIDGISPVTDHDGTEEMHDYRDLIEGEEEESGLRVWQKEEDTPGVTYTRSIGDSVAKELGVIADPEMVMLNLEAENDVIVLASDGIFEFLTNQSVIDICVKCKDEGPLKACEEVISRSREYWEKYENHVDDMTMICIFIESSGGNGRRRK